MGVRRRGELWLQLAGPWLLFVGVAAVVAALQLPSAAVDPGRTGDGQLSFLRAPSVTEPTPRRAPSTPPRTHPVLQPDVPGGYAFSFTQRDGLAPVAYDPCRPIRFVVNARRQPPGGQELLDGAIATISAVTGLRFEAEGMTDEPPVTNRPAFQPERYGDRWAPVLIAWSDAAELPDLTGAAGIGGSTRFGSSQMSAQVYVSGIVALDGPAFSDVLGRPDGAAYARGVILHELAHLLGLGHSADPTQLMHPSGAQRDIQAGDLAGLSRLGTGPCFAML